MRRAAVGLSLLVLAACGDGGGCDGVLTPLQDPLPTSRLFDKAAAVRITASGVETIEAELPSILVELASSSCTDLPCPTEGHCTTDQVCAPDNPARPLVGFKIPRTELQDAATCMANVYICPGPDPDPGEENEAGFGDCNLYVNVNTISLVPGTGNLGVAANINARTTNIKVRVEDTGTFCPDFSCNVRLKNVSRDLTTSIEFRNDNALGRLDMKPSAIDVTLTADDIELDGDFECDIAGFGPIKDFIFGLVGDSINEQLQATVNDTITDLLAESCADGPCSRDDLSSCVSEVCKFDSNVVGGGNNVPRLLGVEGTVDLAQLLGGFAGASSSLDFAAFAGSAATSNGGLNVVAKAGAYAPSSDCVPDSTAPNDVIPAFAPGGATPSGVVFDAAVGASQRLLDTIGQTAFAGGALCQALGGFEQLNTGAVALLVPSISELTGGDVVPMLVDVRPRAVPRFEIGRNVTGPDPADPTRTVLLEPLINLVVDDLDLDLYAEIQGTLLRVATLQVDLVVDLSLEVNTDGDIVLVAGDASRWLRDVEILNSEPLREDPAEIEAALPTLLGLILPLLSESLDQTFSIPPLNGFLLDVIEIAGVQSTGTMTVDGDPKYGYVSIFADLGYDPTTIASTTAPLQTTARATRVDVPDAAALRAGALVRVQLRVDAEDAQGPAPADLPLTLWHRVDRGPWHPLVTGRDLVVVDPVLHQEGAHVIEVAAALPGRSHTLDPTPFQVPIVVDALAPVVSLTPAANGVVVEASDTVTAIAALMTTWRLDGVPQGALVLDAAGRANIAIDATQHEVDVVVTDEAGRAARATLGTRPPARVASSPTLVAATTPAPPAPTYVAADEGGCAQTSTSRSATPAAGLAVLAALAAATGRRRRS